MRVWRTLRVSSFDRLSDANPAAPSFNTCARSINHVHKHTHLPRRGHCGSCALLIDDALDDLPGVRRTWTTKGCTVVALDLHHHSPTDVVDTIAALGYHACLMT
ncbi:hypothetical protein SIM91_00745 [Rhodococcus opacus]|nr:hypothetical protein [Rhodococcus opacus]